MSDYGPPPGQPPAGPPSAGSGGYGAGGYGAGGYGAGGPGAGGYGGPPPPGQWQGQPPDNYLVWAILSTVLCCLPLGIVSIVFSSQVNTKWAIGDQAGALESSRKAKQFAMWSAITHVVLLVVIVIVYVVVFGLIFGLAIHSSQVNSSSFPVPDATGS